MQWMSKYESIEAKERNVTGTLIGAHSKRMNQSVIAVSCDKGEQSDGQALNTVEVNDQMETGVSWMPKSSRRPLQNKTRNRTEPQWRRP